METLKYIGIDELDDSNFEIVVQLTGGGVLRKVAKNASANDVVSALRMLADDVEISTQARVQ